MWSFVSEMRWIGCAEWYSETHQTSSSETSVVDRKKLSTVKCNTTQAVIVQWKITHCFVQGHACVHAHCALHITRNVYLHLYVQTAAPPPPLAVTICSAWHCNYIKGKVHEPNSIGGFYIMLTLTAKTNLFRHSLEILHLQTTKGPNGYSCAMIRHATKWTIIIFLAYWYLVLVSLSRYFDKISYIIFSRQSLMWQIIAHYHTQLRFNKGLVVYVLRKYIDTVHMYNASVAIIYNVRTAILRLREAFPLLFCHNTFLAFLQQNTRDKLPCLHLGASGRHSSTQQSGGEKNIIQKDATKT